MGSECRITQDHIDPTSLIVSYRTAQKGIRSMVSVLDLQTWPSMHFVIGMMEVFCERNYPFIQTSSVLLNVLYNSIALNTMCSTIEPLNIDSISVRSNKRVYDCMIG